jgi:hypothetical protein
MFALRAYNRQAFGRGRSFGSYLAANFEKLIKVRNHTKSFFNSSYQTNSLKLVVGLDLLILDQPGTAGFALPMFESKSKCSSQKDQNHPSNNQNHDHHRTHPRRPF